MVIFIIFFWQEDSVNCVYVLVLSSAVIATLQYINAVVL